MGMRVVMGGWVDEVWFENVDVWLLRLEGMGRWVYSLMRRGMQRFESVFYILWLYVYLSTDAYQCERMSSSAKSL